MLLFLMLCVREFIHMLSHVYLMSSFWENLWFLVWVLYFLCACGFVFYSLSLLFVFIFIFFSLSTLLPSVPPPSAVFPLSENLYMTMLPKTVFLALGLSFCLGSCWRSPLPQGLRSCPPFCGAVAARGGNKYHCLLWKKQLLHVCCPRGFAS